MRVLYICTGNSFRSPVAEALTRKYKPEFEVESAGVQPAESIADNAKEYLQKENSAVYIKPGPDPVTERALREADLIIVMEKDHERYLKENFHIPKNKIRNWNVKDPINPDVDPEETIQEIKEKIKKL